MPKRTDLSSGLILGTGPIAIGQACEFDPSPTQACKALREPGYRGSLANSNPATIMSDPELAGRAHFEPVNPVVVKWVDPRQRLDALLSTMGGQNALNVNLSLADDGVLDRSVWNGSGRAAGGRDGGRPCPDSRLHGWAGLPRRHRRQPDVPSQGLRPGSRLVSPLTS